MNLVKNMGYSYLLKQTLANKLVPSDRTVTPSLIAGFKAPWHPTQLTPCSHGYSLPQECFKEL